MMTRVFFAFLAAAAMFAASSYQADIAAWHTDREAKLKADGGWLSLAGLFWLHEGSNPFGKDPSNEIALPDGPAHAGVFEFRNGKVTLAGKEIKHDTADPSVKVGRANLYVIKRADKFGIRVKDPES